MVAMLVGMDCVCVCERETFFSSCISQSKHANHLACSFQLHVCVLDPGSQVLSYKIFKSHAKNKSSE